MVVGDPVLAVEDGGRLVQPYVAERYGGPAVPEEAVHAVSGVETPYGTVAVHARGVDRGGLLAAHDAELQRLMGDVHAFVEQSPEPLLVAVRLQGDARKVHAHHAEIETPVLDVLAGLGVRPRLKERTASHRGLEATGDFDDVLIEDDIRVHALGGALERQPLHVVVRVPRIGVDAVPDREHELREDGRLMVGAEANDSVEEYRPLNLPCVPRGAQAEADGHERGLAVGDAVGVDLVLHGLHGVVDGLAGPELRIHLPDVVEFVIVMVERRVLGFRYVGAVVGEMEHLALVALQRFNDLTGDPDVHVIGDDGMCVLKGLVIVEARVTLQHLVGAVHGLASVLATGDVLDDLRDLRGGGADGLRGVHHRVAQREAVGEHVAEVRQRAVRLGGERGVVEVVEVDVALPVGVGDRRREHVERHRLGHRAGQQVALRGVDVGVLVGVLMGYGLIAVHESADGLVHVGRPRAVDVPVQSVLRVGPGHIVQMVVDQRVFDEVLDVLYPDGFGEPARRLRLDLAGHVVDHP